MHYRIRGVQYFTIYHLVSKMSNLVTGSLYRSSDLGPQSHAYSSRSRARGLLQPYSLLYSEPTTIVSLTTMTQLHLCLLLGLRQPKALSGTLGKQTLERGWKAL
jgi:hypothetical protein